MEKKTVLRRFNLLNSQNDHYKAWVMRIEQILYYAESRFWMILNNLASANDTRLLWGQKLLRRELVSLSHVINFFSNN